MINERLAARGYESATAYLIKNPLLTLRALVHELARPPYSQDREWHQIQDYNLLWLVWREALAEGTTEQCARALLCRRWVWGAIEHVPRDRIFDLWKFDLPVNYRRAADLVASAALHACLDAVWMPREVDDPALIELVGNHWKDHLDAGPLSIELGSGPPAVLPLY